jgi:HpcH/HpaI aldolase/citrate lyase family
MSSVVPYHFVQQREAADFGRFYSLFQAATPYGGYLCFDLEDSLAASTEAATNARKAQGRSAFRAFFSAPFGPDPARTVLRINGAQTPHFAADIELLRELPSFHAVILPKANSAAQVQQVLDALPPAVERLIPIIETAEGMANVAAISALPDARLTAIAFGHCDLNLSLGHFPFHHQDSAQYWQWVATLDHALTANGIGLLNSPLLHLADGAAFSTSLHHLATYPSATGQITLSLVQTRWCAARPAVPDTAPSIEYAVPPQAKLLARRLITDAQAYALPNSALALTPERVVVSPQEVQAAQVFLRQLQPASAVLC